MQRSAEEDFVIPGPRKRMGRVVVEWAAVIVGALVMALLVKAFLFQAYYIPSPSMEPTLGEGDRIIVNKLSYRLHDVNRGDMVVFSAPEGAGGVDDLIKRVIGLPGELVRVEQGRVLIGEGMLLEPYLPIQNGTDDFRAPSNCANLPEDREGCRVPPGHVFVLGDYRDNSRDSRFFGPISEESIRGRAFLRIWPLGEFRRL
jgi:signal peptidase I